MNQNLNRQQRRRLKADPNHYYWLGRDLLTKEDWSGAAQAFQQGIKLAPRQAALHRAYGLAIVRLDQFSKAIDAFKRTIELDPTQARAWSDLGVTMLKAGMGAPAIPYLERALLIEPDLVQARTTLAMALANEDQTDRAIDVLDHAVVNVEDPDVQYARGTAKLRQALVSEAVATLRRALELDPKHLLAHHNLLFTLQHSAGITAEDLYREHAIWGQVQRHLSGEIVPGTGGSPDPERLPVIGLASGDLRRHAVGLLTIRAVEGLARRGYRIVAFANQAERDDVTDRFRQASAKWHQVDTTPDADLAAMIRQEKIDVLLDLAGHTGRHRLAVFAMKPAPLQGSWAGYVGTTGLAEMDFLVADPIEVPADEDRWYTEKILRMPDCYTTYEPPAVERPVSPPPCLTQGHITFGCFNRPSKLNLDVFRLWAKILERVPESRLLIKYAGVDTGKTRDVLTGMAAEAGIENGRLILEAGTILEDMLAGYDRVDVALDPLPYSGGVTTLEAVWMGVPVVTLRGQTFAGRHSASHLSAMGCAELVSDDAENYVERAVALALDRDRLTALRGALRQRLLASPLCDGDRFAAALDGSFREMWRHYCEGRRAAKEARSTILA